MRGSDKVIALLNSALKEELTAINQYFLHAEMCEAWGYQRISAAVKATSIEEMKHAESLIERILFLEGSPTLSETFALKIGANVSAQFENDLRLETQAVADYNAAIKVCVQEGDNVSRDLFQRLLADEERHADWLESQIYLVKEIGLQNYLAQNIGGV